MREILFRGKAIKRTDGIVYRTNYKNGDWVYGVVSRLYDKRFEYLSAEMTDEYGISGIEVDYKTIGQYTGLTDKNGAKIFEGDIIKYNYNTYIGCKDRARIGYIEYVEDLSRFYVNLGGDTYDDLGAMVAQHCKIIGNIHDNPELLK